MSGQPAVRLSDATKLALEAPYTFFIPSAEARRAVRAGDFVQLVFEWDPPVENYIAERMWVRVSAVDGDVLDGVLDNVPFEKDRMQLGDPVRFGPDNIININWTDPAPQVDDPPSRSYWERCMVDQCVLDGSEPVEFVYREEPDLGQEGDKYPDSGWRIRGRMGNATDEEIAARKADYVAIGTVLNRDDSWLHLIDSPVGSAFMRDFASGQYNAENS